MRLKLAIAGVLAAGATMLAGPSLGHAQNGAGQCYLERGYAYRPAFPGGTVYATVRAQCTEGGISKMEIWGDLYMWSKVYHRWVRIDTAPPDESFVHETLTSEAFAECNGGWGTRSSGRWWTFHSHLVFIRNGTQYIESKIGTNWLKCTHKV